MDYFGVDPSAKKALNKAKLESFEKTAGNHKLWLGPTKLYTSENGPFRMTASAQASWLKSAFKLVKSDSNVAALSYDGLLDEARRRGARPDRRRRREEARVQRVQARLVRLLLAAVIALALAAVPAAADDFTGTSEPDTIQGTTAPTASPPAAATTPSTAPKATTRSPSARATTAPRAAPART